MNNIEKVKRAYRIHTILDWIIFGIIVVTEIVLLIGHGNYVDQPQLARNLFWILWLPELLVMNLSSSEARQIEKYERELGDKKDE